LLFLQIDGKLLCWLCTLSYKRALTKAKQVESDRRRAKKRPADNSMPVSNISSNNKNPSANQSSSVSSSNPNKKPQSQQQQRNENNKAPLLEIPEKMAKNGSSGGGGGGTGSGGNSNNNGFVDPNSSDHVVAMTNLKETIASLHKKVAQKDRELLQKDKEVFLKPWKISNVSKKILNTFPSSLQMTELKAKNFVSEQELRNKAKDVEKQFELKVEYLNKKLANQLKEIAQLTRSSKNPRATNSVVSNKEKEKEKEKDKDSETANSSGGSGTESPVTN
jgi:hypothetical protein